VTAGIARASGRGASAFGAGAFASAVGPVCCSALGDGRDEISLLAGRGAGACEGWAGVGFLVTAAGCCGAGGTAFACFLALAAGAGAGATLAGAFFATAFLGAAGAGLRVSGLLCNSDLIHASGKGSCDDDLEGNAGRAAEGL
jgi:hypothetical protein